MTEEAPQRALPCVLVEQGQVPRARARAGGARRRTAAPGAGRAPAPSRRPSARCWPPPDRDRAAPVGSPGYGCSPRSLLEPPLRRRHVGLGTRARMPHQHDLLHRARASAPPPDRARRARRARAHGGRPPSGGQRENVEAIGVAEHAGADQMRLCVVLPRSDPDAGGRQLPDHGGRRHPIRRAQGGHRGARPLGVAAEADGLAGTQQRVVQRRSAPPHRLHALLAQHAQGGVEPGHEAHRRRGRRLPLRLTLALPTEVEIVRRDQRPAPRQLVATPPRPLGQVGERQTGEAPSTPSAIPTPPRRDPRPGATARPQPGW